MDLMAFRSRLILSIFGIDLRSLAFSSVMPFSPLYTSMELSYYCNHVPQSLCLLKCKINYHDLNITTILELIAGYPPSLRIHASKGRLEGKLRSPFLRQLTSDFSGIDIFEHLQTSGQLSTISATQSISIHHTKDCICPTEW